MNNIITLDKIKNIKNETNELLNFLRNNTNWGINDGVDWELFINAISLLHPSSYGTRIQNKLSHELKLITVNKDEEKGDCKDSDGNYYEIKSSILTHSKSKINFVQIRLFHDCNYLLTVYDIRESKKFKLYIFELDKEKMKREIIEFKVGNLAHGREVRDNSEYRLSITPDMSNSTFKRWCDNYIKAGISLN